MLAGKSVIVNGNSKRYADNFAENIFGVYVDESGQTMTVYSFALESTANSATRMTVRSIALSVLWTAAQGGDIVYDYVEQQ